MKRTKVIGVAVAIAAVAAGCSAQPRKMDNPSSASRDVNVVDNGSGGCTIQPVQDIDVKGNSAVITWLVKPASKYQFDTDGIKFVEKPGMDPIPSGEFTKKSSGATSWVVKDGNKKRGKFGYEVHVKGKPPSKASCMLDPIVFNDGSCDSGC